mmetsp:Transcript_13412/g.28686  ORF Transcript_13412/g.28686 Transcript_13412/m.28686 type:complete len:447 (+) Transcript_13412:109-1449(+)|eukprot:CAMPEP_0202890914 /NCGR_PEP_ID=MMETSP1392-20130828/1163_1 /ASSEMBLY_ACC=CAM_ASM_000868 /TAXON_ID=225041 /ORGANISM="Chlamydomonas chlamydogama, Strain SAG 11-48b" /LENGTH=446 /DNA_ID=CAMNT_0049574567 /DNA_START=109 /DNA_END=1449 /DNA_ORIENTATION=+
MSDHGDITVQVKHGASTYAITLPPSSQVSLLQKEIEKLTNIFCRHQKLIHKGKVLDPAALLSTQQVTMGSKIMLMASGDVTKLQTKGQQASEAIKKQKQEEAQAQLSAAFAAAKSGGSALAAVQQHQHAAAARAAASSAGRGIDWEERKRTWAKIGIVSIRDVGVSELPADVFVLQRPGTDGQQSTSASTSSSVGSTAGAAGTASTGGNALAEVKAADLSCNQLSAVPACLSLLPGLHTLKLASNRLTDSGMPWDSLAALGGLTQLLLDNNLLSQVPACVSCLTSLQHLSCCSNQLHTLPTSGLGALTALESLQLDDNKLTQLPSDLGGCTALVELSACGNSIAELPPSMSSLGRLQALRMERNRMSSLPAALLASCTSLWSLALGSNPITLEGLRGTPGFTDFDARRRAKCDKQLGGNVMFDVGRSFSEGADQQLWQHWHKDRKL